MIVSIESLDHEGRGITHVDGKVIFIEGALPGEEVTYTVYKKKSSYEMATMKEVTRASFMRVTPKCPHFGICGGCSLQHLEESGQVAVKQRVLEDDLWHIGKVRAQSILQAIHGEAWGYRQRARISVKDMSKKKDKVLVGFHEKRSSFVVDMHRCEVLPPHISALIEPLGQLIGQLSIRARLPQIEIALGQDVNVLVLRIMDPLTPDDEGLLKAFADQHKVQFWTQTKGPDTVRPFYPLDAPPLNYTLPEFGITMPFQPTEFTQVNPVINRLLVRRALALLDPQPGERIADLFCGLGNFTLPIARRGATVVGVEGSAALVARAVSNAEYNGLAHRAEFRQADLFQATPESLAALGHFDKMLIDPPRDGAAELIRALEGNGPKRIVYVSCNPSTLARDAALLVHAQGYILKAAGVANMFPHTAHVESIALFEKE
ncbi:MAG: 23S rRNA (uracil(1939)-C(5))-methyltransferase RlmD [Sulfurimicrobium sp.]|nr:23S rRNA (uracil(1939)-C(5))-methyltransferase RlmD [Sulfurimicrobium sp.]MDP1705412.1 23S rRNA (uracil(1939)-C(5))-methyltransferase RlmD [Sulfurimicrobium sp.]